MKQWPDSTKDLESHGEACENIHNFLERYWEGVEGIQPKDYTKFLEGYSDYDGVDEWEDNERASQEDYFKGFDDSPDGFNLVRTLSTPAIAYDDRDQGRNPLRMLISAVMAYGYTRGEAYAKVRITKEVKMELGRQIRELGTEVLTSAITLDGG